jgi:hypothetical protein
MGACETQLIQSGQGSIENIQRICVGNMGQIGGNDPNCAHPDPIHAIGCKAEPWTGLPPNV